MSKVERFVGDIIVAILLILIVASFFYNTFLILFRDGRGGMLGGGRASIYMSEVEL